MSLGALALVGALLIVVLGGRALDSNGEDINTSMGTAAAAARVGDFRQCVAKYTDIIQRAPQIVAALSGRAECSLNLGDGSSAISDLNRAISLSPADLSLVLMRAEADTRVGNASRARDDYLAVSHSTLASTEQAWNAVRGLIDLNFPNDAVQAAAALARAHPGDWYALDALGGADAAVVDAAGSQREYAAAFQVGGRLQRGMTMAEQAEFLRGTGDLNGALSDADQAVKLNPRWEYYRLRAELREATGDVSGADSDFGQAIAAASLSWWIDQTPVLIGLLDQRAHLLLSAGRVSDAASDIRKAIARAPDDETRKALQAELSSMTASG